MGNLFPFPSTPGGCSSPCLHVTPPVWPWLILKTFVKAMFHSWFWSMCCQNYWPTRGRGFFLLFPQISVSLCPCLSLAQWSHYSWVSLVSALLFLFQCGCILLLSFACASLPPWMGVLDHSGGHWMLLSEAVPQPQVSWSSQLPEASVVKGTEKKLDWWTGAEAVCGRRGGVGCEGLGGRLRSWKGQPGKIQLH